MKPTFFIIVAITTALLIGCTHNNKKRVIETFIIAKNNSITANHSLDSIIQQRLANIQLHFKKDPAKMKPFILLAEMAISTSDTMVKQIQDLKLFLVKAIGKPHNNANLDTVLQYIDAQEDFTTPTNILIGAEGNEKLGKAYQLKMKLCAYRKKMINLLNPLGLIMHSDTYKDTVCLKIGLLFPPMQAEGEDKPESWEEYNFGEAPLVSDIVTLAKLQNDVRSTELTFLNYFLTSSADSN